MIWSILALAHSFSRFVRYGTAKYWLFYLTQWTAVAVALYFSCITVLHSMLLRHIERNHIDVASAIPDEADPNMPNDPTSLPTVCDKNAQDIDAVFNEKPCHRKCGFSFLAWLCTAFFSLALAPSLCITMGYWLLMVNWATHFVIQDTGDFEKLVSDVHLHGVLLLLLLVDFRYSMISVEYRHVLFPFLWAVGYATWSAMHFAFDVGFWNGESYIYPLLNWQYPLTAAMFCGGLIVGFVSMHYLLVRIKSCILGKWKKPAPIYVYCSPVAIAAAQREVKEAVESAGIAAKKAEETEDIAEKEAVETVNIVVIDK